MKQKVLVIFLSSLSIISCKKREFGATVQMGAEFPRCQKPLSSITSTDDSEDLFPRTPFSSANEFDVALLEEVQRVLKTGTPEERRGLDSFFEAPCLDLAKTRDLSFAATFREQFYLDRASLARTLLESESNPVAAKRSGGNVYSVGGLVFIRGDLFPEGYYRGRYYAATKKEKVEEWATLDHMLHHTPWFELDRVKKRYSFRTTGASKRLSEHLVAQSGGSEVTLYHGGVTEDLSRPEADPRYQEKGILQSNMFFATPAFRATGEFTATMVIKLQVPKEEILAAVETGNAYIGAEFSYIEVAFFNSPVGRQIVSKYAKPYCYKSDPIAGLPPCSELRR